MLSQNMIENAKEANTAPAAEDGLRTLSVVGGVDLEGLSLYEKKCLIINDEFDKNGFGRYQAYIWMLCGFGYFLDLLWAQAFGLILSPLEQELGFAGNQSGNISIAFSSGLTAGAFVWGLLTDLIGRKWSFNLTCLFSAVFGLGLGGCNTYTSFLVLTAFCGFGIGGNIPIDTTICLEAIPQSKRFLLALLSIWQPIGVVVTSALAYAFIPTYSCTPNFSEADPLPSCNNVAAGVACCTRASNYGWRYLCFCLGGITLGIFILRFFVFNFQESPKFLVYRGQDEKAIAVLQHIAKVNKRECGVTMATFDALTAEHNSMSSGTELLGTGARQLQLSVWEKIKLEFVRYRMLFSSWPIGYLTILIWLTYICDFWAFTLAGTYLPTILAIKGGSIDVSLQQTYRSYVYIYLPGIVGVLLGSLMYAVPHWGKKWSMVISSALMGVSIFVFSSVNSEASNIGLNVMEYFFQSMFNALLYGATPTMFPAPVRGSACGLASFWGRLFGILAPITAQSLIPTEGFRGDNKSINQVLYLAGGLGLGATLTTALLPNKRLEAQSM